MVLEKFHCCDPSVEEIKCPFKGRDLDLKIAFLLPTVSGKKDENGNSNGKFQRPAANFL